MAPALRGWFSTDEDEIQMRRFRAATEPMDIQPLDKDGDYYSTFAVRAKTTLNPYRVEIRSLDRHENTCTCPDFRVNGLGTCKHVEAVPPLREAVETALIAVAILAGNGAAMEGGEIAPAALKKVGVGLLSDAAVEAATRFQALVTSPGVLDDAVAGASLKLGAEFVEATQKVLARAALM